MWVYFYFTFHNFTKTFAWNPAQTHTHTPTHVDRAPPAVPTLFRVAADAMGLYKHYHRDWRGIAQIGARNHKFSMSKYFPHKNQIGCFEITEFYV